MIFKNELFLAWNIFKNELFLSWNIFKNAIKLVRHAENFNFQKQILTATGKFLNCNRKIFQKNIKNYLTNDGRFDNIFMQTNNKQTTNTTTEEHNMILSGKDLMMYRLNQIKRLALMIAGVLTMTAYMMLIVIAYC